MGAVKAFYHDCAEAGRVPLSAEAFGELDDAECRLGLDWIEYCEHDYRSPVTGLLVSHDCITVESARRLVAEGVEIAEVIAFLEYWGDLCPA